MSRINRYVFVAIFNSIFISMKCNNSFQHDILSLVAFNRTEIWLNCLVPILLTKMMNAEWVEQQNPFMNHMLLVALLNVAGFGSFLRFIPIWKMNLSYIHICCIHKRVPFRTPSKKWISIERAILFNHISWVNHTLILFPAVNSINNLFGWRFFNHLRFCCCFWKHFNNNK